jgi:hypothetical protein
MKGVTKGGMTIGTKSWEPDGRPIPGTGIQIRTPALYKPLSNYTLVNYTPASDVLTHAQVKSDATGRITFASDHEVHQIGIFGKDDPAEITLAAYRVNEKGSFLEQSGVCLLGIRLMNRGGKEAKGITATLSSSTHGVTIANPILKLDRLPSAELVWLPDAFRVTALNQPVKDGSPFRVRFNLTCTDEKKNTWKDEFDVPVFYNAPEFTHIGIDDGDSEIFGSGNGDNTANPGETLMIYEISNGSHRLRLYYDDPWVDSEKLYDEIQPDKWGDGYSLSSLIHISKDCPPGHQIRFLACYEVKDWKAIRRDVTWGTCTITVAGN